MKFIRPMLLAAALAVGFTMPALAQAQDEAKAKLEESKPQDFPTKPIELMIAYGAGGGMDLTARKIAKVMERYVDQPVNVVNRTGGGGMVGHTYLLTQAPSDGHTIAVLANTLWSDGVLRSNGEWSHTDVQPIAFINYDPVSIVTSGKGELAGKDFAEVVEMAINQPESLQVGIVPGTLVEFLVDHIARETGAKFIKVPFQSAAAAVTAVLGGHIDLATAFLPEYRAYLETGDINVLAVSAQERMDVLPDVPTIIEAIDKNIVWTAWRYIAVPDGVPEDRVTYLANLFNAVLDDPELTEDFENNGAVTHRNFDTPAKLEAEIEKLFALEKPEYEIRMKSGN
jgi:tripartite-type tricarboxylate transporter receptor subunit TctC